jgi:zinc transport system substrate-binding protein
MPKAIIVFTGVILFCSGMFAPSSLQAKRPERPLRIVCTILPVYILTLNIVDQIPGIDLKLLLPPQLGCPHNYDLTPSDLIKLSQADLIIANGLGLEEFIGVSLRRAKLRTPVLLAAEKVAPIRNSPEPTKAHRKGHKTEEGLHHDEAINGHAWVSPQAAAVMVRTIAEGLAIHDPDHAKEYRLHAEQYAQKLEGLGREMKEWVSRAKNKKVLAFHDILAYLARDIGLTVIGVVESYPGIEPSPKEMARLITLLKDHQATAIFTEPQYSDKVIKALSRESGVPFFELDPVATGQPAADTFEKRMKKNLEVLKKALQ